MELNLVQALFLFLVATVAGCVDTIAGGGGLLTLPAMIIAGLPPAAALATNKLQGSSGTLVSSLYFIRKKVVHLNQMKGLILMTLIGSVSGGALLLAIQADQLTVILPVLLISMGLYVLFSPDIGDLDRKSRLSFGAFSLLVAPLLGFYDGFFGPGAGTFMTLAFVSLCGFNLARATATAKVTNFTSNISALLYFTLFGEIYWGTGLVMIGGQIIGATIGAKLVMTQGTKLIRPVVVVVCFAMSISILLRSV